MLEKLGVGGIGDQKTVEQKENGVLSTLGGESQEQRLRWWWWWCCGGSKLPGVTYFNWEPPCFENHLPWLLPLPRHS